MTPIDPSIILHVMRTALTFSLFLCNKTVKSRLVRVAILCPQSSSHHILIQSIIDLRLVNNYFSNKNEEVLSHITKTMEQIINKQFTTNLPKKILLFKEAYVLNFLTIFKYFIQSFPSFHYAYYKMNIKEEIKKK